MAALYHGSAAVSSPLPFSWELGIQDGTPPVLRQCPSRVASSFFCLDLTCVISLYILYLSMEGINNEVL